jgi:hypothetical protein
MREVPVDRRGEASRYEAYGSVDPLFYNSLTVERFADDFVLSVDHRDMRMQPNGGAKSAVRCAEKGGQK